ncbi:CubicO group peptidase, beta-lactamase class C family [Chryseobacterium carnipullorum]|uniref:serine hydrolase domain-containing protein n=1 Tax=Chryseobacterium carnipullorum TaxID=1124835 RepID=UPI0009114882|nr:serine hydrolase domain-containing protein [Chryseobacterium carnipullorum]SHM13882.1 CubicO group peptidase, beta-lactamase class C family [Chryseobacterium carnipullorum]
MKKTILFTLSLLSVFCLGQKSVKEKMNLKPIVDHAAQKMVEKPLINAVSIGIVYQGQEYIGHYGELEKGKSNLPNNETIYEIGSLGKTLTGTLVAKAVLDKKLKLEDSVQKYLSEDYPNLSFNGHPVLIKDLVTHTSGLPKMLPLEANAVLNDFTNEKAPENTNNILKNYKQKDFLRDLHTVKLDAVPGHQFSYSNAGIELLSAVLEKVYHEKFEVILKEYFADNLQMKHTKINLSKKEEAHLAVGYHCDYNAIAPELMSSLWGSSGNVKTTLPDMMEYIKYQLKNTPEIAESHKPLVKIDDTFSSGYTWRVITDEKLGTLYKHHGGVFRAQCFIYIIPKYNLGVFIITNQSGVNTAKDMQSVLDEIFGGISL